MGFNFDDFETQQPVIEKKTIDSVKDNGKGAGGFYDVETDKKQKKNSRYLSVTDEQRQELAQQINDFFIRWYGKEFSRQDIYKIDNEVFATWQDLAYYLWAKDKGLEPVHGKAKGYEYTVKTRWEEIKMIAYPTFDTKEGPVHIYSKWFHTEGGVPRALCKPWLSFVLQAKWEALDKAGVKIITEEDFDEIEAYVDEHYPDFEKKYRAPDPVWLQKELPDHTGINRESFKAGFDLTRRGKTRNLEATEEEKEEFAILSGAKKAPDIFDLF